MAKYKTRTIDVRCKQWRDKVNGNSYFAGTVRVNYEMKGDAYFEIPFQGGSGSQFEHEALKVLKENGYSVHFGSLKENGIIFRSFLQTGCLKRDLK